MMSGKTEIPDLPGKGIWQRNMRERSGVGAQNDKTAGGNNKKGRPTTILCDGINTQPDQNRANCFCFYRLTVFFRSQIIKTES